MRGGGTRNNNRIVYKLYIIMVVLTASEINNLLIEHPVTRRSGLVMLALWTTHGGHRNPLRFQITERGTPFELLPEALRGGVVRTGDGSSPHIMCVDVVLRDPRVISALAGLEDAIVRDLTPRAHAWWPTLTTAENETTLILREMLQPVCAPRLVKGREAMVLSLQLRPWDSDPPKVMIGRRNSNGETVDIRSGDVTDVVSGCRMIPIIQVTGVSCRSKSLRLLLRVTELLIYE